MGVSFQRTQWRKLIYNGLCCINQYHTLLTFKILVTKNSKIFIFRPKMSKIKIRPLQNFHCPKTLNQFWKNYLFFRKKWKTLELCFLYVQELLFIQTKVKYLPQNFSFFGGKVWEKPLSIETMLISSHRYLSYKLRSFQGHFRDPKLWVKWDKLD